MNKGLIAVVSIAFVSCSASLATAQDPAAGAAAGAAVGAGVGAIVGGPVGAAVGAGVGGTVGAGTADAERSRREERVIIEERAPARERNCVSNAAGTTVCEDIRR